MGVLIWGTAISPGSMRHIPTVVVSSTEQKKVNPQQITVDWSTGVFLNIFSSSYPNFPGLVININTFIKQNICRKILKY